MSWNPRSCALFLGVVFAALGCDSPHQPPAAIASPDTNGSEGLPVEVTISGFENHEGKCRVAAYESASSFQDPEQAVDRSVLAIEGESVRWTFRWRGGNRDQGDNQIAISAYHDRNDNGRLDKSLIGIPTDRYGFSNNPKRGYGPPKFDQAAMAAPEDASQRSPWRIEITVK